MRLCGASLIYVGNVLSIAINLASALSMYAAAKRLFGHRGAAACASIGYTLAMYRLSDVFTRYAVGEAIAMAILPMFIWALWEVVCGDQRRVGGAVADGGGHCAAATSSAPCSVRCWPCFSA